ncbi:ABC transporter ATP-binding protein [Ligilactobacillus pabuli]|uniref:ABC transporter ATP-binding protein n=1 Tax=Ligilactobacillus pabuli TaxID=2886039 RepID=A0ABQ5JJE3_9LACO|nr:ATP-binding cassette domain-containing protein [Ligilactobacillus pabuli]GKS82160.1 ABC transporter ATP-binding protein [Ligilactobacillus pabuli]
MKQIVFEKVAYQVGQQQILHNISLQIDQGEVVTIAGPSGSGKSTLVKLLASLLTPTAGQIWYQGRDITQEEPVAYRRKVSYAMQQPTLFGKTVRENLQFPYELRQLDFDEQRALAGLQAVGLTAVYLDREVKNLSGGERQRVALLRNILILPEVLIMDEVTAGLDANNREIIAQLVAQLQQEGVTIIIVTHDEQEIARASRLVEIKQGQIMTGGQASEFSR